MNREPELTENAKAVLEARYLIRDKTGRLRETPGGMFARVAKTVAEVEKNYGANEKEVHQIQREFFDLMTDLKFLPNSPTLMNANRRLGMLSACFVLPVPDSIEGIFDAIKYTAVIQKAGGGTGFAFDSLRPAGDRISTSGGPTSGPVSFWRIFAQATDAIQQGAFRRGANMAMCAVDHPDVLKFIVAKQHSDAFTNFNVSIKCTHAWMKQVQNAHDSPHLVCNRRTKKKYYLPRTLNLDRYVLSDLIPANTRKPPGADLWTVGQVWELICRQARATGEPGLAFIDTINADNPTPAVGRIEATNPCGEQPLLPYEACNLGSLNLKKYVLADEQDLDWSALADDVRLAVRFLDNVIDANRYPLAETAEICRANRKIGLGVMGFADALFALGVPYDSEEAIVWAGRIMAFIQKEAHEGSESLARTRGTFPNFPNSIWSNGRKPMRNAAVTTVAPTGTLSIIANCSGGIEPLFSVVFFRRILDGKSRIEVHPLFMQIARQRGFYSEALTAKIAEKGGFRGLAQIPLDVRRLFVCAKDVPASQHVRIQAKVQQYCDAAVAKTINLPRNASLDDVKLAYELAFESGCKGVTVYRDGSRAAQPMVEFDEGLDAESGRTGLTCPKCGSSLGRIRGCLLCENCGFTGCDLR